MEILFYGIINSISLTLMALGFTLVYGISRVPNFAHGALYVFAGFLTWIILNKLGLPYPIAIILALILSGLLGALISFVVLVRIRGMEMSEVIATYALGVAILEGFRWAGFKGMTYTLPPFINGSVQILGVPIDYQRILVVVLGVAVLAALWLFTRLTRMGLALRGIAQDERAAMMLGIDSDLAATIAMGIGCSLAGLAAVILLPLGNIVIEAGYNVLIFAIAVCVVGGLGSWGGAVVASFVIGFAQILTVAYIRPQFQMVVALLAILITLIVKPSGFFGRQKELEERV
ncbi:MAG: branched-chain amino acid ABC transporter permease [Deltaproteobacteria bacterium]|nr:MAG: branched-chain amino acid ABC transporter permease [Deltaproteobacteria bacterium]